MNIVVAYIIKFLFWSIDVFVGAHMIRLAIRNFKTGRYFLFGFYTMLVISAAVLVAKVIWYL